MEILNFLTDLLSTPAIFIGLIALIGLLLQKKSPQQVITGTIKSILGFMILNAGSQVIQQAINPFSDLFHIAFNVHGVVPNNEAIVSVGFSKYAISTSLIFALGMLMNILLARFSKLKFIFLSGHHTLYMACLITIVLTMGGMEGWMLVISGSLLLGLLMCVCPAIMQPTVKKITGSDKIALAHFGTTGYWISAQIGKMCNKFKKGKEKINVDDIKLPKSLSLLRDNSVSISIVMFICYFIVCFICHVWYEETARHIWSEQNWFLFGLIQSITFAAGVFIVITGVRMLIAEIIPAFKGFSEKIVPNAKPALDCPTMFPYGQNTIFIGFICSFFGGIFVLIFLIFLGSSTNLVIYIILPGAVAHFFCGATAGICGNSRGGLTGCIIGSFVNGIIITVLSSMVLVYMGENGLGTTTFADADFCLVGCILGTLIYYFSCNTLFIIIIILFALPIIYNIMSVIKSKTKNKEK